MKRRETTSFETFETIRDLNKPPKGAKQTNFKCPTRGCQNQTTKADINENVKSCSKNKKLGRSVQKAICVKQKFKFD